MAVQSVTTKFTHPSDTEVVGTTVIDAPRQLVWDAHTQPEHVRQWLLGPEGWEMPVAEIDLRPGGRWHYVWKSTDGDTLEMDGEYREVEPPERIVNTENWGGDWPETLNVLTLTEENGKTRLESHVLYISKHARDRALSTGMEEGWGQSYDRLQRYLNGLK